MTEFERAEVRTEVQSILAETDNSVVDGVITVAAAGAVLVGSYVIVRGMIRKIVNRQVKKALKEKK
jgi:hypothetical protein